MKNKLLTKKILNKASFWVFTTAILIIAWFYNFDHILFLGPQSVHFWRQADCLSFAQNFMMEDRGLFHPALNYIGMRGDGETASDFPLIYYLVGKLWQLFGQNEWIYRLLVFSIFSTAISIFYNSLRKMLGDIFWAGFISLLLFTSPVIAYYSLNFLVNIPSFSLEIIGLSCFYLFYTSGRNYLLWLSCIAYLIGGLIKIPALTTFVILCFVYLTEVTGLIKYRKIERIFKHKVWQGLLLLMVIIPVVLWLMYVTKYNKNNGGIFLVGIYPIWELDYKQIKQIIDSFFEYWYNQHLSPTLHILSLIMLVWIFINFKRVNPIIRTYIILTVVGVISYILLWFQAMLHHDYYLINTYILFLIVWAVAIKILLERFPRVIKSFWVKLLFLLFLGYNIHFCQKEINLRYNGWKNDKVDYYHRLVELKPKLREMGISRLDTVVVMGDYTINGSLYLLDQKGWSDFGGNMEKVDPLNIENSVIKHAKYLILLDTVLQEKEYVRPFTKNLFLQQNSIKVFILK